MFFLDLPSCCVDALLVPITIIIIITTTASIQTRTLTASYNSNQVDLRILNEMGVSLDKSRYETKMRPVQKFRAGVFAVMAAIRMSNLEEQWRDARIIGEEVKLTRAKQARALRSRGRVLEV